jgi:undecaprenyl-phosphate 4-deoxy-4-formamido-L-arabinose transferase
MKTSVVVPVYDEEGNLPELLRRLTAVMDAAGSPYELVFVDDGSQDGSLAILRQAAAARPDRIRVLELARNFGQHQAILAAFESVSGDIVVTLDADLQNPPEEIPKLLVKIALLEPTPLKLGQRVEIRID